MDKARYGEMTMGEVKNSYHSRKRPEDITRASLTQKQQDVFDQAKDLKSLKQSQRFNKNNVSLVCYVEGWNGSCWIVERLRIIKRKGIER